MGLKGSTELATRPAWSRAPGEGVAGRGTSEGVDWGLSARWVGLGLAGAVSHAQGGFQIMGGARIVGVEREHVAIVLDSLVMQTLFDQDVGKVV